MKSTIEKVYSFDLNGYTFEVTRNKRKDCFLSMIANTNNREYIDKIIPKRSMFLTLKGAKNHAIEMIKLNTI